MRRIAVAAVLVAAVGACGDGELPRAAAADLQRQVSLIRRAAEAGRPGIALGRLETLLDDASLLLERGVADEGRVLEIVEAAEAVRSALSELEPSVSPSPSSSPSPSEEENEEDGEEHGNEGKGKGKGKDKGHGNDD